MGICFYYEPNFDTKKDDYSSYDKTIESFNLSALELEILNSLMSNVPFIEIVKTLNLNRSTIWNLKLKLRKKLSKMI